MILGRSSIIAHVVLCKCHFFPPTLYPSVRYIWVIDQEWDQDGWIFCMFKDRSEVEVHKLAKKERGQYQSILAEQAIYYLEF